MFHICMYRFYSVSMRTICLHVFLRCTLFVFIRFYLLASNVIDYYPRDRGFQSLAGLQLNLSLIVSIIINF